MARKETEEKCFEHIKQILPNSFSVIKKGESNSNNPDLEIWYKNNIITKLEIKEKQSQAGQFVVKIENNKFIFSLRMKQNLDPCVPILDYLNKNFDDFKNVSQKCLLIDIDEKISERRLIKEYINDKGVSYFITKDEKNFYLLKTEHILNFFNVKCFLRKKKSGSSRIPRKDYNIVEKCLSDYMEEHLAEEIYDFLVENDTIKIVLDDTSVLKEKEYISSKELNYVLYLSVKDKKVAEVRKLSKTNNPNVIFELSLKDSHPETEVKDFIKYLEKSI